MRNDTYFNEFKALFSEIGFTKAINYKHNDIFEFFKTEGGTRFSIFLSVGWNEKGFNVGRVYSEISFNSVVEIFNRFIKPSPFGFAEPIVKNHYITKEWSTLMDKLRMEVIKSNADLEEYKVRLFEYLKNYEFPFFVQISSLRDVNDKIIDKVEHEVYTDFIPGQSNFKVLIIMKLLNNPKYIDFKNWALEAYKRGFDLKPERYGADYKTLKQLIDYLDKYKL